LRCLLIAAALLVLQAEPPTIKAKEAKGNVGKNVTVCGTVIALHCEGSGSPMLLDLDSVSSQEGVTIAVASAHRGQFGPRIEDRLVARAVCATGVLQAKEKQRFPLAIDRPEQLRVQKEPSPVPPILEPSAVRACDEGVEPPKRLTSVAPRYPASAIGNRTDGVALLDGVVRLDGTIGDIALVRSSGSRDLDVEAARSFRQWTFTPGSRNGRAVAVVISVQISFTVK
jgi:periplasmic protein TonB